MTIIKGAGLVLRPTTVACKLRTGRTRTKKQTNKTARASSRSKKPDYLPQSKKKSTSLHWFLILVKSSKYGSCCKNYSLKAMCKPHYINQDFLFAFANSVYFKESLRRPHLRNSIRNKVMKYNLSCFLTKTISFSI